MTRVAVDCMGADRGPEAAVRGALEGSGQTGVEVILVGDGDLLRKEVRAAGSGEARFEIAHASEIVEMHESPAAAIRRKKDSSIVRAVKLVRDGEADVVVSGGNTGAAMTAATLLLGRLGPVERPAIAVPLPARGGDTILLDAGANVDCRPVHLVQFAVMGSVYASRVLGKREPGVGLLSIGAEESKGNELTKDAYQLLSSAGLRFLGNVEGRDIFSGEVDVVVCDGFVGNAILKSCEGIGEMLESFVREEMTRGFRTKLAAVLAREAFGNLWKRVDYAERGGALLLGVKKGCIICHGSSSAKAMCNAVRLAGDFVSGDVNGEIEARLEQVSPGGGGREG